MKFPGPDVALFTNITTGFWLEAEFNSTLASGFVFETVSSGIHAFGRKVNNFSVLAMYCEDIIAAPVAVWFFGRGLPGQAGSAKKSVTISV